MINNQKGGRDYGNYCKGYNSLNNRFSDESVCPPGCSERRNRRSGKITCSVPGKKTGKRLELEKGYTAIQNLQRRFRF